MKDDDKIINSLSTASRGSILRDSFTRMGASLLQQGGDNRNVVKINVENLRLVSKEEFKKQGDCQVCFCEFSKTNRQHHCRLCANAVCTYCSYSIINKERACDICAYHYSQINQEKLKAGAIGELTDLAVKYLGNKNQLEEEIKKVEQLTPSQEKMLQDRHQSEDRIKKLNLQLAQLTRQRKRMEAELEQVKQNQV